MRKKGGREIEISERREYMRVNDAARAKEHQTERKMDET